jgi:hypothetical protein
VLQCRAKGCNVPLYAIVDDRTLKQGIFSALYQTRTNDGEALLATFDEYRKKYEGTDVHPVLAQKFKDGWKVISG